MATHHVRQVTSDNTVERRCTYLLTDTVINGTKLPSASDDVTELKTFVSKLSTKMKSLMYRVAQIKIPQQ